MTRPSPPSACGELDELLDVVSQLVDRVLRLEQHSQQPAQDTARDREQIQTPFRWDDLDPEQLRRVWQELGAWVRWLCERFRLDDIPPCWYQHGDLVDELTGLWLAWASRSAGWTGSPGPGPASPVVLPAARSMRTRNTAPLRSTMRSASLRSSTCRPSPRLRPPPQPERNEPPLPAPLAGLARPHPPGPPISAAASERTRTRPGADAP